MLSAYDAASHQRWRETLCAAFADFHWTVLTLPPRYFSWRIRGNSLSWAYRQRDVLTRDYDIVIATSMVDLSALRGLVPALAAIPTLVYFHENQFAYPQRSLQFSSVEPQMLNLYTALAADTIAFNSAYNRDTFLQGVEQLLAKMPDQVPAGIVCRLAERSLILPVPVACAGSSHRTAVSAGPLQLLWNHRWEYDKAPERLFAALKRLLAQPVDRHLHDLQLHIVGQQFRQSPPVFAQMKTWLDRHHPGVVKHWGYLASQRDYRRLLGQADVVISTAVHDFQGLAVIEAVAAGCIPAVPDRLCYGEWFAQRYRYHSSPQQPEQEADALAAHLLQLAAQKRQGRLPATPDV